MTRAFQFVSGVPVPTAPYFCELVEIETAAIPYALAALEFRAKSYVWAGNQAAGVQLIRRLQVSLLMRCSSAIVEAIDRQTRLLDTALNGTVYSRQGEDIVPALADVPPENTLAVNALRAQITRLTALLENLVSGKTAMPGVGIIDAPGLLENRGLVEALTELQANLRGNLGAGWFGIGGRQATIADIILASRINTQQDQGIIVDSVEEILGVVSSGGSIATALSNLLGSAADVAGDGGVIAANLALTAAAALVNTAMIAQLQKLENLLIDIKAAL